MANGEAGDDEKTEDPTPFRREQARKEGRVANSSDLSVALMVVAMMLSLTMAGPPIARGLADMMRYFFQGPYLETLTVQSSQLLVSAILQMLVPSLLFFMGIIFVIAILANVIQVGFHINEKGIQLRWESLNPVKGLKRIFSLGSLVKLGISIGKVVLLGGLAAWTVWRMMYDLAGMTDTTVEMLVSYITQQSVMLGYQLAAVLFVLSLLDYAYQKYKFEESLKMSKQEIKDEFKSHEGDPQIKQKRREIHQKLAMANTVSAVKEADVVVRNPTHFAVALKYEAEKHLAPIVTAKGTDEIALKIIEVAEQHDVPVIENRPVARALYRDVKVGQPIPQEMYSVFAEILKYVYDITGKKPQLLK